jgi:hypothetical protein
MADDADHDDEPQDKTPADDDGKGQKDPGKDTKEGDEPGSQERGEQFTEAAGDPLADTLGGTAGRAAEGQAYRTWVKTVRSSGAAAFVGGGHIGALNISAAAGSSTRVGPAPGPVPPEILEQVTGRYIPVAGYGALVMQLRNSLCRARTRTMALSWYFLRSSGRSPILVDQPVDDLVPLENRIPSLTWAFSGSGCSLVFVDQAAQDRFPADLARAGVCCGDAGSGARVRDALADALMGAGGVVMLLVFGQDGAQVDLVQDQGPVENLTAQGADQALADRVHPRGLHRGAHDGGAGGLEDGIEGRGEVRPAVADEEPEIPESLAEVEGQVASLLHCPVAGRVSGDAAEVHPAGAVLDEHQHVQPGQRDSIHVQEVGGNNPGGLRVQETAAKSDRFFVVWGRCPPRAGSRRWSMAR